MKVATLVSILLVACSAEGGNASGNDVTGSPSGKQATAERGGGGPCVAPLNPSAHDSCDFGPIERMRGAAAAVAVEFDGRRSGGPNADRIVRVERILSMCILGPLRRR